MRLQILVKFIPQYKISCKSVQPFQDLLLHAYVEKQMDDFL